VCNRTPPAGDDPQGSLGNFLRYQPHPFPRVFSQFAHGFFEVRAGDQFDAFEPGVIHVLRDRQHHACGHVLGPQALMTVADGRIDEVNGFHDSLSECQTSYYRAFGHRNAWEDKRN
jgi:hypothetical protein